MFDFFQEEEEEELQKPTEDLSLSLFDDL
jgi:hypothetical protein